MKKQENSNSLPFTKKFVFLALDTFMQKRSLQARINKYRTLCVNEVDPNTTCLLTWSPLSSVISL